ncbi:MAG: O-antigen ligase family protein [Opitutus sp.]
MVVTSALTGLLLIVHLVSMARRAASTETSAVNVRRVHPASWSVIPFLVYAAANVLWITPVPWRGVLDWLGWAQAAVVFWVVLNGIQGRSPRIVIVATLVALGGGLAVVAGYQRFVAPEWLMLNRTQAAQFLGRSSGFFGMPNSLAAYLILVLPISGALGLRRDSSAALRLASLYVTLVLGFALVLTLSRGAWLSFGLAIGLWPMVMVRGSYWRKLAFVAAAWLGVLLIGWLIAIRVPAARERVDQMAAQRGELSRPVMWKAAWETFSAHPVWGSGAGSYGVAFELYRPPGFQLEPRWAHHEYLNTLSDYGVMGFVLAAGGVVFVLLSVRKSRPVRSRDWFDGPEITAGLMVGTTAFALQMAVDFNLKIPALAMCFAITTATLLQRLWPVPQRTVRPSRAARVVAVVGVAGIAAFTWAVVMPVYRAEAIRQAARRTLDLRSREKQPLDESILVATRAEFLRAAEWSEGNGDTWADASYATSLMSRYADPRAREIGAEAESYADRALACSPSVAEFWVRRGVALDLQGRWIDAGAAFTRALTLAPAKGNVWLQHALHLSRNPGENGPALAAAAFCLRLDPGNAAAHALHERLAERSRAP